MLKNEIWFGRHRRRCGDQASGGDNSYGTLYRIDLTTKKLQKLHDFCREAQCVDGGDPLGRVVQNGGSIFGVASIGGTGSSDAGAIYQYTP
jgi:hypothetical protein